MLAQEAKKLWRFIEGADNVTKQHQKENMFFQMLEGLHESEAKLLVLAKIKSYTNTTKDCLCCKRFGWDDNFMIPEPDVYPQASRSV